MASADDRPQIAAALRMARSTIGAILRRLGLGKPKAHGTWPRLSLPCSSASASRGPRPECQSAAPRTKSLTVPDPFVAPRTHRGACALRGHQSLWNGPPLTAGVMMTSDLKERTDDQDPSRRGGPDDVQPVAVHHLRPAKRQTARQRDRVFSVSTISAVHRIDDRQGKVGETLDHMRLVVGAGKFFARGDVAEIAARREAPPGAAQHDDANRRRLQVGDVGPERLEEIDIQRVELVRRFSVRWQTPARSARSTRSSIELHPMSFSRLSDSPDVRLLSVHRRGIESEPGALPQQVSRRRRRVVSADD